MAFKVDSGETVSYVSFDTNWSSKTEWFSRANLIASSYVDVTTEPNNYFSLDGFVAVKHSHNSTWFRPQLAPVGGRGSEVTRISACPWILLGHRMVTQCHSRIHGHCGLNFILWIMDTLAGISLLIIMQWSCTDENTMATGSY